MYRKKKYFYLLIIWNKTQKLFFLNTFPKLDSLGFGGDLEDIVGTAYLAATYLDQIGFDKTKLVYVVGSSGITQELDDVGIKYLPIGVNWLNNPTSQPTYPTTT